MTHVQTVLCPECGRNWTGEFADPPKEAVCRDCIVKHQMTTHDHPDVHINPAGKGR